MLRYSYVHVCLEVHVTDLFFPSQVLLFSVCFRQTNIVWVVFVAGSAGLEVIEAKFYKDIKCMTVYSSSLPNFTL